MFSFLAGVGVGLPPRCQEVFKCRDIGFEVATLLSVALTLRCELILVSFAEGFFPSSGKVGRGYAAVSRQTEKR